METPLLFDTTCTRRPHHIHAHPRTLLNCSQDRPPIKKPHLLAPMENNGLQYEKHSGGNNLWTSSLLNWGRDVQGAMLPGTESGSGICHRPPANNQQPHYSTHTEDCRNTFVPSAEGFHSQKAFTHAGVTMCASESETYSKTWGISGSLSNKMPRSTAGMQCLNNDHYFMCRCWWALERRSMQSIIPLHDRVRGWALSQESSTHLSEGILKVECHGLCFRRSQVKRMSC